MAMGKGIAGMVAAGGKMGGSGVKGAVAARKAASVAAAAGGPKATRPTTGKSGFGVLGAKAAGSGMGKGPMGAAFGGGVAGRTVGDTLTSATGKNSKKSGGLLASMSGRKKPSGMY